MDFLKSGFVYKWTPNVSRQLLRRAEQPEYYFRTTLKQHDIFLLLECLTNIRSYTDYEVLEYGLKILFQEEIWWFEITVDNDGYTSIEKFFELIC